MKEKFEAALKLLFAKKYIEAKDILEELSSLDPKNPDILYNLGLCYSEMGDFQASVRALNDCLESRPDNPNALAGLGFSYFRLGSYEDAEKALLQALAIEPNNLYAINNLAGVYGKLGKYELALKILELGEKSFPDDHRILYGLAISHQKMGNLQKASEYFKAVVAMGIDQYSELAKTGLREIAQETFKRAGLRPDAVMYCLSALQLFSKKGKPEIQKIAFEIGLKGRSGLDTNDSAPKYQIVSLPGLFSGLQLVCYMYVGFKIIAPEQDIGFDLSKEYEAAKNILDEPEAITWN